MLFPSTCSFTKCLHTTLVPHMSTYLKMCNSEAVEHLGCSNKLQPLYWYYLLWYDRSIASTQTNCCNIPYIYLDKQPCIHSMHAVLQNQTLSHCRAGSATFTEGNHVLAYRNQCGQHVAHGFGLCAH